MSIFVYDIIYECKSTGNWVQLRPLSGRMVECAWKLIEYETCIASAGPWDSSRIHMAFFISWPARWLSQGQLTHKTSLCHRFPRFFLVSTCPLHTCRCRISWWKLQRSPGHSSVDGQSCAGRFAEGGRRRVPAVPSTSHPTLLPSHSPVN